MVANDMKRTKILETIINAGKRYVRVEAFRKDTHKSKQYNAGGYDYCPPDEIEGVISKVNRNNADNVVIAYRDKIVQVSNKGEVRVYATSDDGEEIKGYIHLKNDGNVEINLPEEFNIQAKNLTASIDETVDVRAEDIILNANNSIDIDGNTIEIDASASITTTTPTDTLNGNKVVNGTISATGDVSGATVTAGNGTTGTFLNSVTVLNGIVTAGT